MKYKPGDKVRIKSLDWFNTNRCSGPIICDGFVFLEFMSEYCGKELTIDYIYTDSNGKQAYVMKETNAAWRFTDSMIEGLADEESQDKMVSLNKVEKYLRENIILYVWATNLDKREEWFNDFRKTMEE
jgi:hypothetical protein